MINGYPANADITILNTMYLYGEKQDNGKYSKDKMIITYIDNNTRQKKCQLIEQPDYEYFKLKDNVLKKDYNEFFADINNVDAVRVPYNNLEKHLAEVTGNDKEFYDNIKNGNRYANKMMHIKDTSIFNSDMNIEDHYRYRFNKLYKNDLVPIRKGFFDIEADIINMVGDFPEMGECPVNAITYIDNHKNKCYTFLLRNQDNPQIQEFEDSLKFGLFDELREFIVDHVGGPKKAWKYGIDKLDYEMYFYDDEIKLIHDFFLLVNKNEPDFLLAWNMSFDIPYMIARLESYYGIPAGDIMCHEDFPVKIARYYVDTRNQNDLPERGDFATIGSKTVYLDQMIHFMSRRKGTNFDSAKLDYIGELTVGVKKYDYSHITTNIAELPWKDYKTFVFYNIMDVIVQVCIEAKAQDIDYIFAKALSNNTRYQKVHRQTVFLVNRATQSFYDNGYIIGNNANKFNPKPQSKFPGALVGDPTHNSDYSKLKINGYAVENISGNKLNVTDMKVKWLQKMLIEKHSEYIENGKLNLKYLTPHERELVEGLPINICDNMIDLDYSSLYPSTEREYNMAPNTQIGRIIIDQKVHDKENPFNYEAYVSAGQFCEDLTSCTWLEFCERWLHLAGYKDLIHDIYEYYSTKIFIPEINIYNRNGNMNVVSITNKGIKQKVVTIGDIGFKSKVVSFKVPEKGYSELRNKLLDTNMKFTYRS